MGTKGELSVEIMENDGPHRLRTAVRSSFMHLDGALTFEEVAGRTRLRWDWNMRLLRSDECGGCRRCWRWSAHGGSAETGSAWRSAGNPVVAERAGPSRYPTRPGLVNRSEEEPEDEQQIV